ncbi:MAG: polyhydroxyalkanoate depolymerase [Pseudomonadota bacterium]
MLYTAYQMQADLTEPMRQAALMALSAQRTLLSGPLSEMAGVAGAGRVSALLELMSRARLTHARPPFGIESVQVGNREVAVTERVAARTPFCDLLHFKKDVDVAQPRVLLVAPLSGHFATLLRGTVARLLTEHDVYVTDWRNARDVPLSAGRFGFDDYVTHVIRFLEEIGPGGHVFAVCQPCVQVLAAVAVMAQAGNPAKPRSMTLMAGPIDPRVNPTQVNDLASSKPTDWFERNLISTVPYRYRGAGRRVYPGFVQLYSFMLMNLDRHVKAHQRLYEHLAAGEVDKAERIKEFYDEYFAVLDLCATFYIETLDKVFKRAELATGDLTYEGAKVDPGAIRRCALLTVEGERDDICSAGQTWAAHALCSGLKPHLKRHHLQIGAGHYGVFNGKRWETEVYPAVRNVILSRD